MKRYEKLLAKKTGKIIERHTKEHEHKELLKLGERIPFIKAAYVIGESWTFNTNHEEGKRHHVVNTSDDFGTDVDLYLGAGDKLSDAIKFVACHEERRNFKLHEKNDPENLPEDQNYYEIVWTADGRWAWNKRLRIQIYFDTKSECRMEPTGASTPVMKLICNGNSAEAAEMLIEKPLGIAE